MNRLMVAVAALCLVGGLAFANDGGKTSPGSAPPAGGMDMSKVGPWSRKPSDEKKVKKEIETFFKHEDELCHKGDVDGMINDVDFPVYMLTDDAQGMTKGGPWTREQYTAMMKPMMENRPKDFKIKHKPNIVVLSDSLASVTDDFTNTAMGKKLSGKSASILVKRDGQWKWKVMAEAGWGDMPMPEAPGTPK